MTYYYYTRWKFKVRPYGLDYGDRFHTCWESPDGPKEFLARVDTDNLREFFYVEFDSKEEMEAYWNKADDNLTPSELAFATKPHIVVTAAK
jgi:hypothetical protein